MNYDSTHIEQNRKPVRNHTHKSLKQIAEKMMKFSLKEEFFQTKIFVAPNADMKADLYMKKKSKEK